MRADQIEIRHLGGVFRRADTGEIITVDMYRHDGSVVLVRTGNRVIHLDADTNLDPIA